MTAEPLRVVRDDEYDDPSEGQRAHGANGVNGAAGSPPRSHERDDFDAWHAPADAPPPATTGKIGRQHDLRTVFDKRIAPTVLRGRSPATIDRYIIDIDRLSRFLNRPALVADLNDETVNQMLAWMTELGRAPATVNTARNKLCSLAKFLFNKRIIDTILDVPTLVEPSRTPTAWTPDEIRRLINACDEWREYLPNGIIRGHWWRSLLLTLYDSGERIGAVMAARWSDFNPPYLALPAEVRKARTGDMLHKLRPSTIEAIEAIRHPERDVIWAWNKSTSLIYSHFDQLTSLAGLPKETRNKFHKIRRSTATHLAAAGQDATSVLGHASRRTTEKHYIDPKQINTPKACDILPDVSRPKPIEVSPLAGFTAHEVRLAAACLAGLTMNDLRRVFAAKAKTVTRDLDALKDKIGVTNVIGIKRWAAMVGIKPLDRDRPPSAEQAEVEANEEIILPPAIDDDDDDDNDIAEDANDDGPGDVKPSHEPALAEMSAAQKRWAESIEQREAADAPASEAKPAQAATTVVEALAWM